MEVIRVFCHFVLNETFEEATERCSHFHHYSQPHPFSNSNYNQISLTHFQRLLRFYTP